MRYFCLFCVFFIACGSVVFADELSESAVDNSVSSESVVDVAFEDGEEVVDNGYSFGSSVGISLGSSVGESSEPGALVDGGDILVSVDPEISSLIDGLDGSDVPVVISADSVILYDSAAAFSDRSFSSDVLQGGYYIACHTEELGQVSIFLPYEYQYGSFTKNASGNVVSLRASTVSGIMYRDSTAYLIRWSAFGTPQYRLQNSSGYSYFDLTIDSIDSSNIELLDNFDQSPLFPSDRMVQILILLVLGVLLICQFMKR